MSSLNAVPKARIRSEVGVLLIGDGPTALAALRSLTKSCTVLGVLRSRLDQPADEVTEFASAHGIGVLAAESIDSVQSYIIDQQPDVVVISSFGKILPPHTLELAKFVNVHYSLLPHYRGRANVNWAIMNGERHVGISIHLVAPGLDDGNILFQAQVEISKTDTAQLIYHRLNAIQEKEMGQAVIQAAQGYPGLPQDPSQATYGCGRLPDDGEINWEDSTDAIDRQIRALSAPFPGPFTYLGRERLVVTRAEPCNTPNLYRGRVPGRIVDRSRAAGWVDVLTGDGVLRLFEVTTSFGDRRSAASVIRSTRDTLGLSRVNLLRYVQELEERLGTIEASLSRLQDHEPGGIVRVRPKAPTSDPDRA
jgi:methionyl-tRNA formyltransferase